MLFARSGQVYQFERGEWMSGFTVYHCTLYTLYTVHCTLYTVYLRGTCILHTFVRLIHLSIKPQGKPDFSLSPLFFPVSLGEKEEDKSIATSLLPCTFPLLSPSPWPSSSAISIPLVIAIALFSAESWDFRLAVFIMRHEDRKQRPRQQVSSYFAGHFK